MSVAKRLLLAELEEQHELTLEQQFEEALFREEDRERRHAAWVAARHVQIHLVDSALVMNASA